MQAPSASKLHPYPPPIFILIFVQNGGREPPTPLEGRKERRKRVRGVQMWRWRGYCRVRPMIQDQIWNRKGVRDSGTEAIGKEIIGTMAMEWWWIVTCLAISIALPWWRSFETGVEATRRREASRMDEVWMDEFMCPSTASPVGVDD